MNKRIIITDDFLKYPYKLAKLASKTSGWEKGFKGLEFRIPKPQASRICGQFSKVSGLKFDPNSSNYTGSLRKTIPTKLKTDYEFKAHFDGGWNAIVYLNHDSDYAGGTGFFRHKKSGLDGLLNINTIDLSLKKLRWSLNDLIECLMEDQTKPQKWTEIMRINSKFNRALAFDGMLFHSHISDAGKGIKKPRLTLNYYLSNPTEDLEWFNVCQEVYSVPYFTKLRMK